MKMPAPSSVTLAEARKREISQMKMAFGFGAISLIVVILSEPGDWFWILAKVFFIDCTGLSVLSSIYWNAYGTGRMDEAKENQARNNPPEEPS